MHNRRIYSKLMVLLSVLNPLGNRLNYFYHRPTSIISTKRKKAHTHPPVSALKYRCQIVQSFSQAHIRIVLGNKISNETLNIPKKHQLYVEFIFSDRTRRREKNCEIKILCSFYRFYVPFFACVHDIWVLCVTRKGKKYNLVMFICIENKIIYKYTYYMYCTYIRRHYTASP